MRTLIKWVGWASAHRRNHGGLKPTLHVLRLQRGFTLIELVMVIALAGAVAVMISSALSRPLEGFIAQSRRAELVDLAAGALNRMARDIRLAVPNSVHLNAGGTAIEMFNVLDAGRYRPNRLGGDGLRFTSDAAGTCNSSTVDSSCNSFQVLDPGLLVAGARWLVVYNIGAEDGGGPLAGSNVWAPANPGVITPGGTGFAISGGAPAGETLLTLTPPAGSFSFAYASPQRRFYLADQIVGYRCGGGQLLRFTRTDSGAPWFSGAGAVQASNVTACSMSYQPGSSQRAGLVTLGLTLTLEGESIELFQQVHVDNAP